MSVTAPSTLIPMRNLQDGMTIFKDPHTEQHTQWEGRGDQNGGDIQYVPDTYLNLPAFQSMIRKGIFARVEDNEASQAWDSQAEHYASSQASSTADIRSTIERPEINDYIAVPCAGPGVRSGASCPNEAMVRQSKRDEGPALCDSHKHLAPEYVMTVQPGPDGLQQNVWVRATMGTRQTESSQTLPE